MIKRKLLPVLIFAPALLLGLVGCEDVAPDVTPEENLHPYSFAPTKIETSKKKICLGVDEKTTFVTRISPVVAYDAKLIYESDNEEVATVDDEGEITGVGVGNANITIKYEKDNKVSTLIPVSVFSRYEGKSKELSDALTNMVAYQGTLDEIDTVHCYEYRDFSEYENDVQVYQSIEFTDTYESLKNAFFYVSTHEETRRVDQGDYVPSDYAWIIHTDEGFDTHVYHITSGVKRSLVVPTQSYMDKGTRIDAVKKMLGSLFKGSNELFNDAYEDVLSSKDLGVDKDYFDKQVKPFIKQGVIGTDVVGYSLSQYDFKGTADLDDYEKNGIPKGETYYFSIEISLIWNKGLVMAYDIMQSYRFMENNVERKLVWNIYYTFETENVEIPYPVESQFATVDTLFDL